MMMMRKRAGQDEALVILKDLYKDFAVIMDMYFYAAEVARIIYYLTGDPAWERNWDRQHDKWVCTLDASAKVGHKLQEDSDDEE